MSDVIQEKLNTYQALLHKWQPKINLISNNTLETSWDRHFKDSMQVEKLLPIDTKAVFDLGSGGGFPGLVLAIMRPDIKFTLVESDQKKCSFLKTVSRETQTPVTVQNLRIEAFDSDIVPDVVMARALASLPKLFDYTHKWIEHNKDITLIFPKGEKADEELSLLSQNWQYECRTHVSETDANAKILIFSNICRL